MNPNRPPQPIEILLIEDSPTDALLAKEALAGSRIPNNQHAVTDGVEAMEFLGKVGRHKTAPRPNLILLDLNLPKMDGREVLDKIKNDEALKRIPVVVLTTSRSHADVSTAYGLHANCYVVKPIDFHQFVHVMKTIEDFWFSVATLPGEN